MTLQDISRVTRIENNASPHPWQQHYEDSLNSGHFCRVLTLKNEIIAQSVISTVMDEASLLILTVSAQHQGKGYGYRMICDAIEHVRTTANTLFLEVRRSNLTAFNLYLKAGFSEVGQRRAYYPATTSAPAEDAIIMAKDLSFDRDDSSL